MPDPSQLSKRERQIMDLIYAHGQASTTQILQGLPNPPMRGALRTLLRILETKGHVTRKQEGREFIYRPTQPRGQAGRSAFSRVIEVFFGGSLEKALAAHLSNPTAANKLSAEELRRLAELIDQAKQKGL